MSRGYQFLAQPASFRCVTVGEVFDQASARIKTIFRNNPDAVEAARIRLAEAILSGATEGNTDVEDLKNRAIVELAKTTGPRLMRE